MDDTELINKIVEILKGDEFIYEDEGREIERLLMSNDRYYSD